jgi:hypothetical protein
MGLASYGRLENIDKNNHCLNRTKKRAIQDSVSTATYAYLSLYRLKTESA